MLFGKGSGVHQLAYRTDVSVPRRLSKHIKACGATGTPGQFNKIYEVIQPRMEWFDQRVDMSAQMEREVNGLVRQHTRLV